MKLVKIADNAYINAENVDLVVKNGEETTSIYLGDNRQSYVVDLPISEVVELLCDSEKALGSSKSYQVSISTSDSMSRPFFADSELAVKCLRDLKSGQTLKITK